MYFDGVSYRLRDEHPPILPSITVPNGIFTRYRHLNSSPANIEQPSSGNATVTTSTWRSSPISSTSAHAGVPRRAPPNFQYPMLRPPTTIMMRGRPRAVSSYVRDPLDDAPYLPPPAPVPIMPSVSIPIYEAQPLTFTSYFRPQTSAANYAGPPLDNLGYILHPTSEPGLITPSGAQNVFNNDMVLNLTNKTTKKGKSTVTKKTPLTKKASSAKKTPVTKKTLASIKKPVHEKRVTLPSTVPPSEEAVDAMGPYDFSNVNICMTNADVNIYNRKLMMTTIQNYCQVLDAKTENKLKNFLSNSREIMQCDITEITGESVEQNPNDNVQKQTGNQSQGFFLNEINEDAHLGDVLEERNASDNGLSMEVEDMDQLLNANGLTGTNGILSLNDILGQNNSLRDSNVFPDFNNVQCESNGAESNNNFTKKGEGKEPAKDKGSKNELNATTASKTMNLRYRTIHVNSDPPSQSKRTKNMPKTYKKKKNTQKKESVPKNGENKKKEAISYNTNQIQEPNIEGENVHQQNDPNINAENNQLFLQNEPMEDISIIVPNIKLESPQGHPEEAQRVQQNQPTGDIPTVVPNIKLESPSGHPEEAQHVQPNQPTGDIPTVVPNIKLESPSGHPDEAQHVQPNQPTGDIPTVVPSIKLESPSGHPEEAQRVQPNQPTDNIPNERQPITTNRQQTRNTSDQVIISEMNRNEANNATTSTNVRPSIDVNCKIEPTSVNQTAMVPKRLFDYATEKRKLFRKLKSKNGPITELDQGFVKALRKGCVIKCNKCELMFVNRQKLAKHLKWHANSVRVVHNLEDEGSEAYYRYKIKCNLCRKMFPNLEAASDHKKDEHGAHSCPFCKETFLYLKSFYKHFNIHLTKNRVCKVCNMQFLTKISLVRHKICHRTKTCQTCFKQFCSSVLLDAHELRHGYEKTYCCNVCFKAFHKYYKFKKHRDEEHLTSRPFKCSRCPLAFEIKITRDRHEVVVHNAVELLCHHCTICSTRYLTLEEAFKHKRIVHGEIF